jgi:hypothetical protein
VAPKDGKFGNLFRANQDVTVDAGKIVSIKIPRLYMNPVDANVSVVVTPNDTNVHMAAFRRKPGPV